MKTELMDDLVAKIESNNTNITQKFEEIAAENETYEIARHIFQIRV